MKNTRPCVACADPTFVLAQHDIAPDLHPLCRDHFSRTLNGQLAAKNRQIESLKEALDECMGGR
jgi:hypothetical protein